VHSAACDFQRNKKSVFTHNPARYTRRGIVIVGRRPLQRARQQCASFPGGRRSFFANPPIALRMR
jgi:hypothetical protein